MANNVAKLKLSNDRKVSQLVSEKTGSPKIPNSFGLPAKQSCPGATEVCKEICYAFQLERVWKGVANVTQHNYDVLKQVSRSPSKTYDLLSDLIAEYNRIYENKNSKLDYELENVFRIHWDGDFFSANYAKAWARVIKDNPQISFWAYTRSFTIKLNVIPYLYDIDNLALYLSVDKANAKYAKDVKRHYPNVRIALLDDTFAEAQEQFVNLFDRKAPPCPAETGKYKLHSGGKGACVNCMMCVDSKNHVLFAKTKEN